MNPSRSKTPGASVAVGVQFQPAPARQQIAPKPAPAVGRRHGDVVDPVADEEGRRDRHAGLADDDQILGAEVEPVQRPGQPACPIHRWPVGELAEGPLEQVQYGLVLIRPSRSRAGGAWHRA